jgi:hypothetical protein
VQCDNAGKRAHWRRLTTRRWLDALSFALTLRWRRQFRHFPGPRSTQVQPQKTVADAIACASRNVGPRILGLFPCRPLARPSAQWWQVQSYNSILATEKQQPGKRALSPRFECGFRRYEESWVPSHYTKRLIKFKNLEIDESALSGIAAFDPAYETAAVRLFRVSVMLSVPRRRFEALIVAVISAA